jgi:hypothetical protein
MPSRDGRGVYTQLGVLCKEGVFTHLMIIIIGEVSQNALDREDIENYLYRQLLSIGGMERDIQA